ncbi:MAG: hypothetical protein DWP98_09245 [Bacteroidetes bacterium]|nr:MAG: hypothetical protein DWP98_09245 [Bacteroidota bacterium]MBL1144072.1 hypothetical protein [Bacteroidota bacterium]NOG56870.1 hypothetical protein [Bacteroidota bacterium]
MRLKEVNPTSYVFNESTQDIRKVIIDSLGNRQFRGMILDIRDKEYKREVLYEPGNEDDAYLYSYEFIGKSAMYYSWWGRLKMNAEFHIHLDSVNVNQTKVSIHTYNSEVVTGVRPGLGDNLTPIALCAKAVPPSTVEEYELLLQIGKALGEKNMPALKKPMIW